jgi:hypothetical protein
VLPRHVEDTCGKLKHLVGLGFLDESSRIDREARGRDA